MLYEFSQFMNKRYRIPKGQSRMDHPENWLHWVHKTQGAGKQSKTQNRTLKNSNTVPTKNPGSEFKWSRILYSPLPIKLEITKRKKFCK